MEVMENVEYFTSLMMKFVNTKYRHLYKQPILRQANLFDAFSLFHE
jgi:hypothetical protein